MIIPLLTILCITHRPPTISVQHNLILTYLEEAAGGGRHISTYPAGSRRTQPIARFVFHPSFHPSASQLRSCHLRVAQWCTISRRPIQCNPIQWETIVVEKGGKYITNLPTPPHSRTRIGLQDLQSTRTYKTYLPYHPLRLFSLQSPAPYSFICKWMSRAQAATIHL